MSVTPDKSGASVALYVMSEAPSNADFMLLHVMLPHCSMDWSFSRFVEPPSARLIRVRPPDMLTVYVPAVVYVCATPPLAAVGALPSPQSTVYAPVPGMVMVPLAPVVCHVVIKEVMSDWAAAGEVSKPITATAATSAASTAAARSPAPGSFFARRALAPGRASGSVAGDAARPDLMAPAPGWQGCLQVGGWHLTRLAENF